MMRVINHPSIVVHLPNIVIGKPGIQQKQDHHESYNR